MTDTEKAALERRIDELCAEVEQGKSEFKKMDVWHSQELKAAMAENAKLRELVRDLYYETKSPSNHVTQVEIRMSEPGIEVGE